jgi:uncharacterized membrane protein YgaE (UPF0421/DUF939 family)
MSGPGHSKNRRPKILRLWLSSIDPGLIRLQAAGRAALALLSIWLVLRLFLRLLSGSGAPPIPLFGILSGIVFLLFIIDLKPSDRKVSLWLAPIPFTGAVLLASTLAGFFWLNNLILLLLFFFSYFFRRYGTRAGELALVTTVGFYIGFLLHLPQALYILFIACVIVSVLVVYLWLFVIIPYNPAKSLQRSVNAFYHNVTLTVTTTRRGLESAQVNAQYTNKLHLQLRRVHQNRRVIEGLFSAIVSPALWSQSRLSRLQEEMFKTERSLELLIEAATQLFAQPDKLPADILQILTEGLEALEADLWEIASAKDHAELSNIGSQLQNQVKSRLEGEPGGECVYSALRIGVASSILARSVSEINTIKTAWKDRSKDEPPVKSPFIRPTTSSNKSDTKSRYAFHPTTILGFQAVLATGLAMLAANLLNFDQPNLVYWTAFVVIAGSTGESLRRITLRVIGVIAGTVIGVLLAVLLPDNLVLVVLFVTINIFMMTYMIPVSYIWMVFWLNIAMLLVITTLGGPALDLLILRPVSTLLGGAIAALVVTFVLPIHVQDRFTAALSGFLTEVDCYIEAYVATLMGKPTTVDLRTEELNIDASYKKLEFNLPNVVYEYNPLSRAQNRLASQATGLAVLKGYVTHLNDDIGGDPGSLVSIPEADLVSDMQARIHLAIDAMNGYFANGQGGGMQPSQEIGGRDNRETILEDFFTAEAGSKDALRNRALFHLKRIHDTIQQIASGLGAP